MHAVPGYVIAPDMSGARLFVTAAAGVKVTGVKVSAPTVLKIVPCPAPAGAAANVTAFAVTGLSRGRCRVSVTFSDSTANQIHYSVLPSFSTQVDRAGAHWADAAWL